MSLFNFGCWSCLFIKIKNKNKNKEKKKQMKHEDNGHKVNSWNFITTHEYVQYGKGREMFCLFVSLVGHCKMLDLLVTFWPTSHYKGIVRWNLRDMEWLNAIGMQDVPIASVPLNGLSSSYCALFPVARVFLLFSFLFWKKFLWLLATVFPASGRWSLLEIREKQNDSWLVLLGKQTNKLTKRVF